jgi:uncharacterized SAM-binding protein YcdF (DUF218 family)
MSTGKGKGEAAVALGVVRAVSAREKFLTVLTGGPLLLPDALIVLMGEDWQPRLDYAVGQYHRMADFAKREKATWSPYIVLSGGKHEPPRWLGADKAAPKLVGQGVSHSKILLDNDSQNTAEQAKNALDLVTDRYWQRVMLVASLLRRTAWTIPA